MVLPINQECNQNCLYCSATGRNDITGKEFLKRAIGQTKGALIISGGEPTLSADLFWVIKNAKKKNLSVELQSNGVTFYYHRLVEKLIDAGVDLFNINLPSHISHVHDRITQTKTFLEKKIIGLKNLQNQGAQIRLTYIVNSLNYRDSRDYIEFVKKEVPAVNFIQFSFTKIMGNVLNHPDILISYEDAEPYLLSAFRECTRNKINFVIDHIPACYLGGYRTYHIDHQKIIQSINTDYSQEEKMKLPICKKCSEFNYCYGVRKDYLDFFGKDHTKVKPF